MCALCCVVCVCMGMLVAAGVVAKNLPKIYCGATCCMCVVYVVYVAYVVCIPQL